MIAYFDIRNELTPTASVNTQTETRTLEFITPNALRCHCQEYRRNHFCSHMVFYMVAKIHAFHEQRAKNANSKRKGVREFAELGSEKK